MKTPEEIVKALRWLAMETEFVFGEEQLIAAADLIESLQADNAELRKANSEHQDAQHPLFMALCESQRREKAAVECLNVLEPCDFCKHYDENCICARPYDYGKCFEWRGPGEETMGKNTTCQTSKEDKQ